MEIKSKVVIFHYKSFSHKTVLHTAWGGSAIKKTQMLRGNQTVRRDSTEGAKVKGRKKA